MGTDAFWLGPVGQLVQLTEPGAGIPRSSTRIGGIHTAVDGTPTVDTLGFSRAWEFALDWRYRSELRRLRALHHRAIPDQLRLIDPMVPNRLALAVSTCGATPARRQLPLLGDGPVYRSGETAPDLVEVCGGSIEWTPPDGGGLLTERSPARAGAVLPGEQVTLSAYVRGTVDRAVQVQLVVFDAAGNPTATVAGTSTSGAGWVRLAVQHTAAAGDAYAMAQLSASAGTGAVHTSGWQLEAAGAATEWDLGGGSPLVVVNQLTETSPYYPMSDAGLTLLEV
ncbi:phage head spike fiber domain-containing protein [Saccharopolyspora sp. NPDC003752]